MKITIEYEWDNVYWAFTEYGEGRLWAMSSESFLKARDRLIEKLRLRVVPIPPPEEVEL